MDIQDILEEAERVAVYMNANTPNVMSDENMKTILQHYFETNSSILELGEHGIYTHCPHCSCDSPCNCSIYLDVRGQKLSVHIETSDGLVLGDGPQGNKFGGYIISKKDAFFFVTQISIDERRKVWQCEYNYDDYDFEDP
jgi:hypothetical protein